MSPTAGAFVWTRARADWPRDAGLLGDIPNFVHIPCLAIEDFHEPLAATAASTLVVTSPRGAMALAKEMARRAAMKAPWPSAIHAFGDETMRQIKAATDTLPANRRPTLILHGAARTAVALAPLLAATIDQSTPVAIIGPAEPAYDLAGYLSSRGWQATHFACYRTQSQATTAAGVMLTPADIRQLAATLTGVVCFASPTAVAGFATAFEPKMTGLARTLVAAALGPTTAAAASLHFSRVELARENDLANLITTAKASLIERFPVGSGDGPGQS